LFNAAAISASVFIVSGGAPPTRLDIWVLKYAVVVFSAASDDTAAMEAVVAVIAVCMAATDADRTDATDVTAVARAPFSAEMFAFITLCTDASDVVAVLRDVENVTSDTARATSSAEIAVLSAVSAAASDVDAVAKASPTAVTDAARTLVSVANPAAVALVDDVMAVDVVESVVDNDVTCTPRVLTSLLSAVLRLTSADESATTDELSAAETETIALARFTISTDSALDTAVTSAITLAICVKLGLVVNVDAISASVSSAAGALPFRADISALKALVAADVSTDNAVERLDAAVDSDGSAVLSTPDETDCNWLSRTATSVEMTVPSAEFALTSETSAPLAATDRELVWLRCTDCSAVSAEPRLALADVSADADALVPDDRAATDELRALDSATSAADTTKCAERRTETAPDTDAESDVVAVWRALVSTVSAAFKDDVLAETADAAVLTVLETSDTDWLRALDSLEIPVLMETSAETRADRWVLTAVDRDVTSEVRVLVSVLSVVLRPESTALNETDAALTAVDRDTTSKVRVLISAMSPVINPESTAFNETDAALTAVERDVTAKVRVLISVLSPVMNPESTDNSDALVALTAVDRDVSAEVRALISDATEFNSIVLPLVMVVASDGSFPMAVAMSDSVFIVDDSPSPAMAAVFTFTNDSVAMTLALNVGCTVKSHCPVVVTLPSKNTAFPETSSRVVMVAVCSTAVSRVALPMLAVAMLAVAMLAIGIVVMPVSTALLTGAFNKCNTSSAFLRSRISWFNTAVKSDKWDTTSEFVTFPITMLVMRVQL